MPRTQLQLDLERRIAERFGQWKRDSVALYEMADLEPADVMQDIFLILLADIIHIMHATEMPLELLTRSIAATLERLSTVEKSR